LSETPTPEPLKPDTEEEIAELLGRLEVSDAIILDRNQEIAALQSRLAGKDEIIAEAQEQIARLKSDMSYVLLKVSEDKKSATTGTELPEIGELQSQLSDLKQDSVPASDLTNKTKAICKLVKPWVSAKYVENLNAQIKKEMERNK
jgi:hypothetical protein